MQLNAIVNFIAGAIYSGTFIIGVCLVIINLFKLKLWKIDRLLLTEAINTILLSGAMIYTIMWIVEVFVAYFSGSEYEQYIFTNQLFGSYWWAALALLIRSILLPQILWIRSVRRSFVSTIIIISVWAIIGIPGALINLEILYGRWFDGSLWDSIYMIAYGEQLVVYGLLLFAAYFILKRKTAMQIKHIV